MKSRLDTIIKAFGIKANVQDIIHGPVVDTALVSLEPGTPIRKLTAIADDIALAMHVPAVSIVPEPNSGCIAVQLPDKTRENIPFTLPDKATLPIYIGKDFMGNKVSYDLARAPHMLVAGQTGAGKSVAINTIISSIMAMAWFRTDFVMVDPKGTELHQFAELPNVLKNISYVKDAIAALQELVDTMEERNKILAANGCRKISDFTDKFGYDSMHYIVAVIDEFNDIMLSSETFYRNADGKISAEKAAEGDKPVKAGKAMETLVTRIAQKARSVGIHLILATQRPSVNVVTGTIKANFPTRMAFRTASAVDSCTIIERQGAEKLLGMGDMLFMENGKQEPARLHGAFISDSTIESIIGQVKKALK